MKNLISGSKLKTLFFYIFGIYFLFGAHFYSDTLGGYGLYLPHNIIGWIFITLLIGIGIMFYLAAKEFIDFKNLF